MNENWDIKLKERIRNNVDNRNLAEDTQERILENIHRQIDERSKTMKISKRKMIVTTAAALMVMGTITVMAAGKIVGIVGHSNRNDDILTVGELEKAAVKRLETDLEIPESLVDGSAFTDGQVAEQEGVDENQNVVSVYPEVYARYGEDEGCSITLSIMRPVTEIPKTTVSYNLEEEYNGVNIQAKTDQYLFLPPDAKPSEADQALQAEGKLFIGFGSTEEERKVFKHVSWTKDGLEYRLFTYGDKNLEDMVSLAKGIIDGK